MVYEKVKKIGKIFIFFMTIFILSIYSFFIHTEYETNLAKTILPEAIVQNSDMLDVTNKFASAIKVVFEANTDEEIIALKSKFQNDINSYDFEIVNPDFSKLLNKYLSAPACFLSNETRNLLKKKEYEIIKEKAINELYSPAGLILSELDKDPYLLLNDFLKTGNINNAKIEEEEAKVYDYMIIKLREKDGLSPDMANGKVKDIVNLQKKYSTKDKKIYLAGNPVHSYYTSKNSVVFINIICFLASILIAILTYIYFKNLKLLMPIALSIILGFWIGFVVTKLFFGTFHVITLVFATTLIGIGIDYSYHYLFSSKNDKFIIKNLTFSVITTVTAFILLYFSNIELLKQISVFTISGLLTIYMFVVIVYPIINTADAVRNTTFIIKKPYKIIIFIMLCISVIGFINIKFNDNLTAFYIPDKSLKKAEMLYNMVSGQDNMDTKIYAVKADDFQSLLEREEKFTSNLKDTDFYSISKFIPSINRQKENSVLVHNLYINNLDNYIDILTKEQINQLKNTKNIPIEFNPDDYLYLKDFLLKDNTSIVFVNGNEQIKAESDYIEQIDLNNKIADFLKQYRIKLLKIIPFVFISIFIILSIICKPKKAIKMVLPQIIACFFAIGAGMLLCKELNLFSILALFLILGFTIDYSIFRASASEKSETAVFISCITTSFSFFALSFTSFKLISSLSIILFMGIIMSYIIGLLVFEKDIKMNKSDLH